MVPLESPEKWRRVPQAWRQPIMWVFWSLVFYAGLVISQVGDLEPIVTFPFALVAAFVTLWVGLLLLRFAVAPLVARLSPAVEATATPPPSDEPSIPYLVQPASQYPAFAQARRQCGWVRVALRISPAGRITAYRVVEQTPRRTFERAVVAGLHQARLPAAPDHREMTSLITFVMPSDGAPPWALERLGKLCG